MQPPLPEDRFPKDTVETGTAQPSDPPRTYPQSGLVGLWTLVVVLLVQFAYFSAGAAVRPSNGFLSYYTATQLAAEGAEVSRFYDNAWFMEQARRFQPSIVEVYTPYATDVHAAAASAGRARL